MKGKTSWCRVAFIFSLTVFVLGGMVSLNETANAADKVIKWKCQVEQPVGSSSFQDIKANAIELIEKRANGRIKIELYAASALVPNDEIFNATKKGMIEMGVAPSFTLKAAIPLASICGGLPMNFQAPWEAAYYYHWSGFADMMREECDKHGLWYCAEKINGTEIALKNPIKRISELKGVKVRSYGDLMLWLKSLDIPALYLPTPEIYTGLASGVVDGAHWGAVLGNNDMNFYELCKYHLSVPITYAMPDTWVVNKKALSKLPPDIAKIITSTLEEHFWARTNHYEYEENVTLAKIVKEKNVKIITLPPEDLKLMQQKAMEIWKKIAEKGPKCKKAVDNLIDFNKKMGRL